jgi:predicted O-methyltransferase YrrM
METIENFNEIFENEYAPILGKRAYTFRTLFRYLGNIGIDTRVTIVETGTTRYPDNFIGDGCSTILFDRFLESRNGILYTVDIDPRACEAARSVTSQKTMVVIGDSVSFLASFSSPETIDVLYLDSYDFDVNNPHLSAFHHMKELTAIYAKLKSGCLIVVDDNFEDGVGKGMYVREFLHNVGAKLVFDDYQICFMKP